MVGTAAGVPKISDAELAARRQRIVEAAEACLRRDGPAGLTTRAVVAEAGISTGALYHHFASLEALVGVLAEQRLGAGIAAVAARAPAGEDPLAWAIRALVCAPPLGVPPGLGAAAEAGVERVVGVALAEVLWAAGAAGSLRADVDVEALAELLALLWPAVDRRAASGGLRTSHERLAATLADLVSAGVRPVPDG